MGILDGKVIIVTGASAGIGAAAALHFASEGASVVASSRRDDLGRALIEKIEAQGGKASWFRADIRVERDVESLVQAAVDRYGRLDGAFNNAGMAIAKPLVELSTDDWDAMIDTNLKGTFLCMKYEIRAMFVSGGGAIVNCSSIGAIRGGPGLSAYSASKGGVNAMGRTAALEYADKNIRINTINPGVIETEMAVDFWHMQQYPQMRAVAAGMAASNRIGKPEEIAHVAAFLLSDRAAFVTAQDISVDGGATAAARSSVGMAG